MSRRGGRQFPFSCWLAPPDDLRPSPGTSAHEGFASQSGIKEDANVNKVSYRAQQTIARPVQIQGVGFLTGADVTLRFVPAPVATGVVFVRTDLGARAHVPAHVERVTGTQRRTSLGTLPVTVSLVEHVLAALAGLHIDNCFVEINAPEPPGLDGSAKGFVSVLRKAGVRMQPARRAVWRPAQKIVVGRQGATLALHPIDKPELRISYLLDYGPFASIPWQMHTAVVSPETFANELASCRTFILESEAAELRRQGLGARTRSSDLLIFGPRGPIDNTLRYADEPARHKILDLIGDLSLLGHDLQGHIVAYRSGHPLNVELVRQLHERLACQAQPMRLAA
jgi:UDP-3-O-acyl N-acetylglucosamine deacetylase